MHASGAVLLSLADTFLSQNRYGAAVKCFEAVCLANELPLVEVETRLKLARVLLEHTGNIYEARQHLEKVHLLLDERSPTVNLKCEAFSDLGRCQKYLGEIRLEKQTYEHALQYCSTRGHLFDRYGVGIYQQWVSHFYLRLANAMVADGNAENARTCLAHGFSAIKGQFAHLEAMFLLCDVQLYLTAGDTEAANSRLAECGAIFDRLPSGQTILCNQIRLHHTSLQLLLCLQTGALTDLQPSVAHNSGSKSWPVLEQLDYLCDAVSSSQWQYDWLSTPTAIALANLLASQLLMPVGKFKQAIVYISRGHEIIDRELKEQGINVQEGEEALSQYCIWEMRMLLVLKFFLVEMSATIYLTQCNLQLAQRGVLEMIGIVSAYPRLLGQLSSSAHVLAGHYCMLTGHVEAAFEHYCKAGYLSSTARGRQLAAANAALTQLSNTGDATSLSRATEVLQLERLYNAIDNSLPCTERATALLVSGLALLRQGNEVEGKLRFTKALKIAHGNLGNHQLVTQVLNCMAPLQLSRGDIQGAKNMLTSSNTLAKNLGDLPSQMTCLQQLIQLAQHLGDTLEHQESVQYLNRKVTAFNTSVQVAKDNVQSHEAVVHWDVDGSGV